MRQCSHLSTESITSEKKETRSVCLQKNKCMCVSSHVVCCGCVWLCEIHNFLPVMVEATFVLVMLKRLNVSEPKHWSTWSHRTGINNVPLLRGKESNILVFLLVPDLYWITEDKINAIILYLYLDWHKHTDVIVAVFFHAYWKIILKKLQDITWEI